MITIHGVCISLHKHAPCIVSRVGSGHARLLTAWVLCAFQGETLLATFCFWFAFSTIHGSRWQKSVIPDYVTAQTAPSIGAISQERLYWASFWFCGLGQTPGRNLTPLDSTAWLQPPETQNNTIVS